MRTMILSAIMTLAATGVWAQDAQTQFAVTGAVEKPGMYRLTPQTTVLSAITSARLTSAGDAENVTILRDGGQKRIVVNLQDIQAGKAEAIPLQNGDVLVIKQKPVAASPR